MKLEHKILLAIGLFLAGLVVAVVLLGRSPQRPANELVLVLKSQVKGFDPVQSNDVASTNVISLVYEPPYQYHYLKRPYEAIPCLAEKLPEISGARVELVFDPPWDTSRMSEAARLQLGML
jgi:hypothetical protein